MEKPFRPNGSGNNTCSRTSVSYRLQRTGYPRWLRRNHGWYETQSRASTTNLDQTNSNKLHSTEPLMKDYPNMRYCMVNNTLNALEQVNGEMYDGYLFSKENMNLIERLVEQCNLFIEQHVDLQRLIPDDYDDDDYRTAHSPYRTGQGTPLRDSSMAGQGLAGKCPDSDNGTLRSQSMGDCFLNMEAHWATPAMLSDTPLTDGTLYGTGSHTGGNSSTRKH